MSLRRRPGLTLVELLLVTAVLGLMAALSWPVFGSTRQSARRATCTENLKQIGLAYHSFVAQNGYYPSWNELRDTPYLRERRILFCPDDADSLLNGAASSYRWEGFVLPDMRAISQEPDLNPNTVLVSCTHHLQQRQEVFANDEVRQLPPLYPFHLVLRADGHVERVHVDKVRKYRVPGNPPLFRDTYPGEPYYDQAEDLR